MVRYPSISGGRTWPGAFGGKSQEGEHGGMRAIVKRWLRHYQLDKNGRSLKNDADVVKFLQESMECGV